jgi:transcriptional regulator with XRE-family HTH domain
MGGTGTMELGAFLRAHRDAVKPEDVGLSSGPRRRTPGLRREEVASLAGLGVAWYSWLEQGRVSTTREVLDALARALRLDRYAHAHLITLGGFHPRPGGPVASAAPDPELLAEVEPVLRGFEPHPAALLDRHFDLLSYNEGCARWWPAVETLESERRNLLVLLLCEVFDGTWQDPPTDWRQLAMGLMRQFRAQRDLHPGDTRFDEIVDLLRDHEPALEPWLDCHSVRQFTPSEVMVLVDGTPSRVRCSMLRPVSDPDALVLLAHPLDPAHVARRAG